MIVHLSIFNKEMDRLHISIAEGIRTRNDGPMRKDFLEFRLRPRRRNYREGDP